MKIFLAEINTSIKIFQSKINSVYKSASVKIIGVNRFLKLLQNINNV